MASRPHPARSGSSDISPGTIPRLAVPVPVPARRGNDSDSDDILVDPSSFEVLSRSLTTGGHFLQPEPAESAMFRDPVFNPNPESDELDAPEDSDSDGQQNDGHTERSPLLNHHNRRRVCSAARSTASAASASSTPYLNNTSPARFWLIFSQILAAYFISCFDGTIMASSHPVITSYFNASNSASWLSTAFLLTSSAFQPLLGRLSDAVGRKPLFVGCLGVFALATTWCALAGSIESFILARAACGLGAGGVMTLGSIIVSDLVPIE